MIMIMRLGSTTCIVVAVLIFVIGSFFIGGFRAHADASPIVVGISDAPASWAKETIYPKITCDGAASNCNSSTLKYKTYYTPKGSCTSDDVDTYSPGEPGTWNTPTAVGMHAWICAYACNYSGTCAVTDTATEFKVDETLPTIQAPSSALSWGTWHNPDVHFSFGFAQDYGAYDGYTFYPGSGVATYNYDCAGSSNGSLNDPSTGFDCHLPDGKNNMVSNQAIDAVGYSSAYTSQGPYWIDGTAPVVSLSLSSISTNTTFFVTGQTDDGVGSGILGLISK